MAVNRRLERVSDLLREVGAEVLRHIKDPVVTENLVSITHVQVTPDLSLARFRVSILADKDKQNQVLEALNRASGFVRHEIKGQVHLKRVPNVVFEMDPTVELGNRMDQLFDQVRRTAKPDA